MSGDPDRLAAAADVSAQLAHRFFPLSARTANAGSVVATGRSGGSLT
jgi:hypothetical protein